MRLNLRMNRIERIFNENHGERMNILVVIPMDMEIPTHGQLINCPHKLHNSISCLGHCGDKVKCDLPDNNYKLNCKVLVIKLPRKLPKGWMKNEKP